MPDLVCDGGEFSCNFCTSKLKLTVTSSSTTGDSKKIANQTNCFLPPPGGNCTFPPGVPPSPCPGVPPGSVIATGQSTVKVDGQTALGDGAKFLCPKGQPVTLSKAGQTVGKHDEARGGIGAYIAGGVLVVAGVGLAILFLPEEVVAAAAVGAAAVAKTVAKVAPKVLKKAASKTKKTSTGGGTSKPPANSGATAPGGSKSSPQVNAPYQKTRNSPTVIQNRSYSGHAQDQMQNRGIPPRAVENTINNGVPTERVVDGLKTTNYYDKTNNLSVVVNDKGGVVTVGHGKIGR